MYSDRWKESNQAALNLCDGVYINNNTIVIDKGTKINGDPYTTSITSDAKNTYVYNNIFSSTNGAGMGVRDSGDDKYAYQVDQNSLAINNGTPIQGPVLPGAGTGVFANVPAYPNVDFYGNPIDLSSGTPNIGAYNGKTNAALNTQNFTVDNQQNWLVYPKENNTILSITNRSIEANTTIDVKLYNLKGQLMTNQKLKTGSINGEYRLKIPQSISNGIYILNINDQGKNHNRKLILHK